MLGLRPDGARGDDDAAGIARSCFPQRGLQGPVAGPLQRVGLFRQDDVTGIHRPGHWKGLFLAKPCVFSTGRSEQAGEHGDRSEPHHLAVKRPPVDAAPYPIASKRSWQRTRFNKLSRPKADKGITTRVRAELLRRASRRSKHSECGCQGQELPAHRQ